MRAVQRAGIIGDTGRGDYGHGLDVAFEGVDGVEVAAVADPDPKGLEAAARRTRAPNQYADYRKMLEVENLDLVNVCPRWVGRHAELVIASAESGVKGIFCEKPLAPTLADADEMIEACDRNGVRTVVAHRRAHPYEQFAKSLVEKGDIGDVQAIRSRGMEDHRSGAMDLMVLGTHMMDSILFFGGSSVAWAEGKVTQDGRDVTPDDIYEEDEEVGLMAGNGVAAEYRLKNGVSVKYESSPSGLDSQRPGRWNHGFDVYGTKGAISIRNSPRGELYTFQGAADPKEPIKEWRQVLLEEWERRPDGSDRDLDEWQDLRNVAIVSELIGALHEDRQVERFSTGDDARAALEMIMAVHESNRLKSRVYFPVQNRDNPYQTWLSSSK